MYQKRMFVLPPNATGGYGIRPYGMGGCVPVAVGEHSICSRGRTMFAPTRRLGKVRA